MAYWEWVGFTPTRPKLICSARPGAPGRGLRRWRVLQDGYRVVCPGRGGAREVGLAAQPAGHAAGLCSAVVALIARLGVEQVDWLGTSMGADRRPGGTARGGRAFEPDPPLDPERRRAFCEAGVDRAHPGLPRQGAELLSATNRAWPHLSAISAGFGPHARAWRRSAARCRWNDGRWHCTTTRRLPSRGGHHGRAGRREPSPALADLGTACAARPWCCARR